MAPSPSKRSRPDPDKGSAALPLPLDASYEILLRLPAKDLCRLRAVSRAWRSLLSDPQFIAAHGARHPGPLIVSGHPTSTGRRSVDDVRFNIMDLSGRILKRLHVAGDGTIDNATDDVKISSQAGLVCILGDMGKRCRVLDPATGAVTSLPEGLAEEHAANRPDMGQYSATVVCGKVASTGEYKVLRVLDIRLFSCSGYNPKPLCEVLTLGGSSSSGQWRGKKASPDPVSVYDETSRAVVDGTVYFFANELGPLHIAGPKCIASFDLGTEEWRRTLKGPQIVGFVSKNARHRPRRDDVDYNYFSLAALNGCLAVVHCVHSSFMDLWFLMDFEQGLWVKRHSIQMKPSVGHDECSLRPLCVLNDGRVVVAFIGYSGSMRIYNPKGGTYTNVAEISPHVGFDLYTGNLLSLANGAV
ncbi:unnamed protein product [Urochloa decumbens]|uniref:F-box domain-containing protein n=1 Tax=Urochloa decumbens TaxID=240449 RepID=A0ABC9G6V9_9POAL